MTVNSAGNTGAGRPRRKWRRVLLWTAGLGVCLVLAVALLGPTIAGSIVKSGIEGAGKRAINGKVEVGGASLSWFGAQAVGPVTVIDASGERVATIQVGVERGLLSLAAAAVGLSPMDVGKVSVVGDATAVRYADGRTNLDDLFVDSGAAKNPGGGAGGASDLKLPRGFETELDVEIGTLRLIDRGAGREVRINDLKGAAAYSKGIMSVTMNGAAVAVGESAAGSSPTAVPAGVIRAEATIRDLADATGRLTPDRASAKVDVELADLSMEIAGVLSGIGTPLVQGVGETVRITVQAEGSLEQGRANFAWTSRGVRAVAAVQSEKGVMSLASPATVVASGEAVAALTSMLGPIEGNGVRLERYPGVDLTIGSLRVPFGAGGIDLRGSSFAGNLKTTTAGLAWQGAAGGGAARRVTFGPAELSIGSESLAKGVAAKGNGGVTVDGAAAGRLEVDLAASALLDDSGAWRTGVPVLLGRVAVVDVETAAWQPIAEAWGVDLIEGIGPRAEVVLTATPGAGGNGTGVNVEIVSDGLRGLMRSEVNGSVLSVSGEASLKSPRSLMGSRLEAAGLDVSPGGEAKLVVRGVTIDIQQPLKTAAGEVEVALAGVSLLPRGVRADPLEIGRIVLTPKLVAGERPRVRVEGKGSHEGQEVAFQGNMEFPNLTITGERAGDWYHPEGGLKFSSLPTSLMSLWLGEETGLERLVADSIGPNLTVELNAAQTPERSTRMTIAATSSQVESNVVAVVDDRQLQIRSATVKGTVTPEIAARLVDRFSPGSTSFPSLAGPAVVSVAATPFSIPIKDGGLDWAGAEVAEVEISLQGDIRPPGVQPSVQATLRDTAASVQFPLASLSGDSTPRPAGATIRGTLVGQSNVSFASLMGKASLSIAGGRPAGEVQGELTLDVTDTGAADEVLGKPGFLRDGAGQTVALRAEGRALVAPDGAAWRDMRGEVSIASPKLTTAQPLKFTGDGGRMTIQSPMVVRWTPDPAWLNTYALSALRAGEAMEPDSFRVTEAPELTLRLLKLTVPAGDVPRLAPGVFELDMQVEAPTLAVAAGEGTQAGAVLRTLAFRAIGGHEPGVLGFSLRAEDLGAGGGPSNAPALLLEGGVYGLADSEGRPTPDSAVVSMTGDVFNAPSRVLDALANQDGLLAEVLGPMVAVTVKTRGASQASGKLIVTMTSPRAELELAGEFEGGTFIAEGEPKITLHTMTTDLGQMLLSGMPLIGTFEKRAEDGPAQVKVTGLRVPLDGHLEKLSGDFTVDLGTARFGTSGVFGALLRATQQREAGVVGRRVQPISLSIKDGVLTYSRWKVPLGEFTFDTRGTVDLVNRRMDIVTYLPFGALTDEAAGAFNTGLGRLITGAVPFIEQATMVPFRTRGGYADARTEPDIELFLTETGRTLLRPDRIIRDGLQNIFRPPEKK